MAILVTLLRGIEVRGVIGCFVATTASPSAELHSRPSGNTMAADTPGMASSAKPLRNSASRACAKAGVRRASDGEAVVAVRFAEPPQADPPRATTTTQATARRAMAP